MCVIGVLFFVSISKVSDHYLIRSSRSFPYSFPWSWDLPFHSSSPSLQPGKGSICLKESGRIKKKKRKRKRQREREKKKKKQTNKISNAVKGK